MSDSETPALCQNPFPNQLTLRNTFLFYLKQYAKPRVSLKLMQIAKYFCFEEFPFLVVKELGFSEEQWGYLKLGAEEHDEYDFDEPFPFWVTEELIMEHADEEDISELIPNIAVCDAKNLHLDDQNITLDEFKFLTSKSTVTVSLKRTTVRDSNGDILPLETVLECVPLLRDFTYEFNEELSLAMTSESTKNVIEILKSSQIKEFFLCNIPETFHFDAFCESLKGRKPQIYLTLYFANNISDQYKQKLQEYIDKMITEGFDKCHPIVLVFSGVQRVSCGDLNKKVKSYLYGDE